MPNQIMCVARLASIQFERSDPRFKPRHRRLIFSQIQDKSAVIRAVINLRPLANRLAGGSLTELITTPRATTGWKPCGGVPPPPALIAQKIIADDRHKFDIQT